MLAAPLRRHALPPRSSSLAAASAALAAAALGLVTAATLGSAAAAPEDEVEEPPAPFDSAPRPEVGPREHVQRIPHEPSDAPPTLGPRHAPVRLELFFQPGSANARVPFQLITELWRAHPRRIQLIFRVVSRQGQVHLPAAVLEAAAQGKFFELVNALPSLRGNQKEHIRALAKSVGMDLDRLDAAWESSRYAAALEANEQRRTRMRVRQVPDALFAGKQSPRPVTVMGATDLEAAYREAYARALDARDRGVDAAHLADYLDANALADRPPQLLNLGPADERPEEDDGRGEPSTALLSPPLRLRGLPTRWTPAGDPGRGQDGGDKRPAAPRGLPVLLACNPLSAQCYRHLHIVENAAEVFDDRVRVVWAPMFELRSRDAATVARVADAVLCADQLGVGWSALDVVMLQANRRHGRILDGDRLLDDLIAEADLDGAALAACMAVNAGAAVRRVEELRRSGMSVSPTVVVGGRMYPGSVSDAPSLQGLIEEELTAGWLGRATLDASLSGARDVGDNASIISPPDRTAAPVSRR